MVINKIKTLGLSLVGVLALVFSLSSCASQPSTTASTAQNHQSTTAAEIQKSQDETRLDFLDTYQGSMDPDF
ncbi:hypothetical protein [Celerinatantimonas sp. MCCC 1A17872]|uniref:hypothetical protein n=1 Tax=Celerinatantimonas sp. MCCC 1A17872 TaxID=3177514 RepID=UPI0038C5235D